MSFSSINTALSALRFNRAGLDISASNVANVTTEGYTRRRLEAASVGAPAQPALWSHNRNIDGGVEIAAIRRLSDELLTSRSRTEHTLQSYLDTRASTLTRVETGIGEPSDDGLANILTEFRKSWHDLANNPSNGAARSQVLSRAQELATTFAGQVRNLDSEASDQRFTALDRVAEINTLLTDMAATNRSISNANAGGNDPSLLYDQRDVMALRLAELTGAKTMINTDGTASVSLNGAALVAGMDAGEVTIAAGIAPNGDPDGSPVQIAVTDAVTGTTNPTTLAQQGELAAIVETLNVTLPSYRSQLNVLASDLATSVNNMHADGFDADGNPGGDLFTFDPADPAGSLTVNLTNPSRLAASAIAGGVNGDNAARIGDFTGPERAYQQIVNGFGAQVASVQRLATNQMVLTRQVDGSLEQLAGVNLDEEMTMMVAYQHGFDAASRVITVIDSILDTLINRTGLLR